MQPSRQPRQPPPPRLLRRLPAHPEKRLRDWHPTCNFQCSIRDFIPIFHIMLYYIQHTAFCFFYSILLLYILSCSLAEYCILV